ncbi:fumarylacetoacetase [Rosa chinensis]|uniref:fumarylacetoacetase n=1 Tax=Rosa chinensis TaxID=74649 RepID=UPI000D093D11|nr:fumarylacetoacetase [Rosa chinensis]
MKRPPSNTLYGLFRSFRENNPIDDIPLPNLPSSNFVHGSRRHRKNSVSGVALTSFIEVDPSSHFPIQNLPFGVFKPKPASTARPGVAIGDYVLDLSAIAAAGLFNGPILRNSDCFYQPNLNKFLALGRPAWKEARATLQKLLSSTEPTLRDNQSLKQESLIPLSEVEMLLPVAIGDFTDFFSSMDHVHDCGAKINCKAGQAIPLKWLDLPIAYHGRASSIVISGTDITRPRSIRDVSLETFLRPRQPPGGLLYFGPATKLDFELKMAAVVGPGNELGNPVDVNEAADHIFGLVLMNGWIARDIQAKEFIPSVPFLGKSFGTTISPWIVTLEALEPFSCDPPKKHPHLMPYVAENISESYDITLEVRIKPAGERRSSVVTKSNFNHLIWTLPQQLAHLTVNGCNLRPGDLFGTGTISGPGPESYGSLLELTWDKPLSLNGVTREFLEDGDEVIITGFSKGNGYKVGFGKCSGKIVPPP